jgi:hypothetical protein
VGSGFYFLAAGLPRIFSTFSLRADGYLSFDATA